MSSVDMLFVFGVGWFKLVMFVSACLKYLWRGGYEH